MTPARGRIRARWPASYRHDMVDSAVACTVFPTMLTKTMMVATVITTKTMTTSTTMSMTITTTHKIWMTKGSSVETAERWSWTWKAAEERAASYVPHGPAPTCYGTELCAVDTCPLLHMIATVSRRAEDLVIKPMTLMPMV